ncbi:MAG: M56 family metallopeptidase [Bacteroidota bacterium]
MTQELLFHWTYALGWFVLHAVWQLGLVAMICWLLLTVFRDAPARRRYFIAYSGLVLGALWSGYTFLQLAWLPELAGTPSTADHFLQAALYNEQTIDIFVPAAEQTSSWFGFLIAQIYWLGIAWMVGVCWYALRLGYGLRQVGNLKTDGITSAAGYWETRFTELVLAAGLDPNRVQIRLSTKALEPVTLGFLRPLIIIPYSLVGEIPPAQLEAILWHELGHVSRNDYFFNLIQRLLLSFFFFHPAAHWLSRQIDREREHACDDFAIGQSSNPHALVRALAFLSMGCTSSTDYELAMAAMGNRNSVYTRMQRLLKYKSPQKTMKTNRLFPLVLFVILGGALVAATINEPYKPSVDDTNPSTLETTAVHQTSPDCVEIIIQDTLPPAAVERRAQRLALIEQRLRDQEERLREHEATLIEREAALEEWEASLSFKENEANAMTSDEGVVSVKETLVDKLRTNLTGGDFYQNLHSSLIQLLIEDQLLASDECAAVLHLSPGGLIINDQPLSTEKARPYTDLLNRFSIERAPGRQIRVERQGLRIGHPGQEACSWEGEVWSAG